MSQTTVFKHFLNDNLLRFKISIWFNDYFPCLSVLMTLNFGSPTLGNRKIMLLFVIHVSACLHMALLITTDRSVDLVTTKLLLADHKWSFIFNLAVDQLTFTDFIACSCLFEVIADYY